jgi:hypothetical protein
MTSSPGSISPREALQREIKGSDVLIAVLPAKARAALVFFEVGVVTASHKPVLLITSVPAQTVPTALSDLPRVPFDVVRTSEFPAVIDTLVRRRERKRSRPRSRRPRALPAAKIDQLVNDSLAPLPGRELTSLVAKAFADAGASVITEAADWPDVRPDFSRLER